MGYLGRSCFINMFLLEAGRTAGCMCFIILGQGFDVIAMCIICQSIGSRNAEFWNGTGVGIADLL